MKNYGAVIILHGIDIEHFLSRLSKIIDEKFQEGIQVHTPKKAITFMSRKEVAEFLKISLPTLHDWTKTGWLKSYRIGRKVLYKKHEVEDSLVFRRFRG